jgi:hypothetical protein
MRGLDRFRREHFSPAELARMDSRRRQAIAYALADPHGEIVAGLSDVEVRLLFHLGFSEYHMLSTLCGKPNCFGYKLAPSSASPSPDVA